METPASYTPPALSSQETSLSFFAMNPSRLETMCKVTLLPFALPSLCDIAFLLGSGGANNPRQKRTGEIYIINSFTIERRDSGCTTGDLFEIRRRPTSALGRGNHRHGSRVFFGLQRAVPGKHRE